MQGHLHAANNLLCSFQAVFFLKVKLGVPRGAEKPARGRRARGDRPPAPRGTAVASWKGGLPKTCSDALGAELNFYTTSPAQEGDVACMMSQVHLHYQLQPNVRFNVLRDCVRPRRAACSDRAQAHALLPCSNLDAVQLRITSSSAYGASRMHACARVAARHARRCQSAHRRRL